MKQKNDISKTSGFFVNRINEVEWLNSAWCDQERGLVVIKGPAGIGKSALVSHWLETMGAEDFKYPPFKYTFFSRMVNKQERSAEVIVRKALKEFEDTNPDAGSPFNAGLHLASLLMRDKALLIFDGLERFQNVPGLAVGQIQDEALRGFMKTLMDADSKSEGLCIIITRSPDMGKLFDWKEDREVMQAHDWLEVGSLNVDDGVKLLQHFHVDPKGKNIPKLRDAVKSFHGHPLCLKWLASYLVEFCGGQIGQHSINEIVDPNTQSKKTTEQLAELLIEFFVSAFRKLAEDAEVSVLRLTGLFDHPVQKADLEELLKDLPIPGLTDRIPGLYDKKFQDILTRLKDLSLLIDPEEPNIILHAHPIVQQHFAKDLLQEQYLNGRKEAHKRLYKKFVAEVPGKPKSVEEILMLSRGVVHACRAGYYQEAWKIFWERIRSEYDHRSGHIFGQWSKDLEILSRFFDNEYYEYTEPVTELDDRTKALTLNEAGFDMRALGRLLQARGPLLSSWEKANNGKYWDVATVAAGNMSKIMRVLGELTEALDWATKSVEHADQYWQKAKFDEWSNVWRMSARTWKAEILHQLGNFSESERFFQDAETLQKYLKHGPPEKILWGTAGFRYCDFLLDQVEQYVNFTQEPDFYTKRDCALERFKNIKKRAEKTLCWVQNQDGWLNSIYRALDELTIGRASLLEAKYSGSPDFSEATAKLDKAVNKLIYLGDQTYVVRGLLARAALHRENNEFDKAEDDTKKAFNIADQCSMQLHKADCHLEFACLYEVRNSDKDRERSISELYKAVNLVITMKYCRRNREIVELEKKLFPKGSWYMPHDEIGRPEGD